ncbi:MAG TPA: GNAT family protein [Saprospiraceae bacterium]|nr:GNAT family protein [Saprospiraceae bacterium]
MKFDNYLIRLITLDDLHSYFQLIDLNRRRLEDFFAGTVALTMTLEDTKNHLIEIIGKNAERKYFSYVVVDEFTGQIVSSIQVKNVDLSIPKAELGYYIDEKYESKGIVTRATSLIIKHCFNGLNMNKLLIRTHEENIASKTVAEKNGFILEGIIRSDYKTTSGKIVDIMYYGLLKDEYLENEKLQDKN